MTKRLCLNCNKNIKKGEKHVILETIQDEKSIERKYFHFRCWQDYFKRAVSNKVLNLSKTAVKLSRRMLSQEGLIEE